MKYTFWSLVCMIRGIFADGHIRQCPDYTVTMSCGDCTYSVTSPDHMTVIIRAINHMKMAHPDKYEEHKDEMDLMLKEIEEMK